MKKYALFVAGGSGNRMKAEIPKQFMELNGKPILMHTFDAFQKYDNAFEFFLVLPEKQFEYWKKLCQTFHFSIEHTLVPGGETRFHSVKNGLDHLEQEGIVFIHDGVRPLVSTQTIHHCFQTALKRGNALPVIPPAESVREVYDQSSRAVDRSRFFLVQTPQTFKVSLIKKACQQPFAPEFTDDASVLESAGGKIYLVEGNRENIKITFPGDLVVASALLKKNE